MGVVIATVGCTEAVLLVGISKGTTALDVVTKGIPGGAVASCWSAKAWWVAVASFGGVPSHSRYLVGLGVCNVGLVKAVLLSRLVGNIGETGVVNSNGAGVQEQRQSLWPTKKEGRICG